MSTPVGEVSSEKRKVSTDLKSTVEEVSNEKGEVSTDLISNPIEEVSREIGKVSTTDLKSAIKEVSAQLKESNYEDWILMFTNLTKLVYNFGDQHFPSSTQQRTADIEHQVDLCVEILKSVPEGMDYPEE